MLIHQSQTTTQLILRPGQVDHFRQRPVLLNQPVHVRPLGIRDYAVWQRF
jgi:hypothetical protein